MLSKLKVKLMMDEDILITTLPNNDDFAFIRSSVQVYVDKTKFIKLRQGYPRFLSGGGIAVLLWSNFS